MKGDYRQECNRTACNNKDAIYYNYSTNKYYCEKCAIMINEVNYKDTMRIYGHELCTKICPDKLAEYISKKGDKK